jgi:hypothetical protein
VSGRADVYSLGVVLYLLVAGRLPFESRSVVKLVGLHLNAPPPQLPEDVCPPKLAALICERLLAKEPGRRPDAAEAATLLARKELLEGWQVATTAVKRPEDVEDELRRVLAADETAPEPDSAIGGPACAACELPLGGEAVSIHGNTVCARCLERVEGLDLCAACLHEINATERAAKDAAVFAGHIYCRACTQRVRLPCAVCRRDAALAGLATGQTRVRVDQLIHLACVR